MNSAIMGSEFLWKLLNTKDKERILQVAREKDQVIKFKQYLSTNTAL